ncbi:MAG: alpha/beta fold hydrolase [Planctomycetes bacterium]|nr:alpha/beta fold hydrolase [Planctomycetota bacterium]
MEAPVTFEKEGQKIYGVLHTPDAGRAACAVVLVHGWTGCRIGPNRILVHVARRLVEEGMAALRFDLCGRGDSEGDFEANDLDGMVADTCAAIDFVKERLAPERIAIWGLCSGGNVAIGAGTLRDDIDLLLPCSTLPFQPEQQKMVAIKVKRTGSFAKEYFKKLFRLETWRKLVCGAIHFGMVRKALFGHMAAPEVDGRNPKDSARDIMADFAGYKGKALFIYGGADPEAGEARKHFEEFGREKGLDLRFHVVEGANHNFSSVEWEKAFADRAMEFLKG